MVGGEHRPDGGEHDVDGCVGEGEVLGVSMLERRRQPLGGGPLAGAVQQGRHVVDAGHLAEAEYHLTPAGKELYDIIIRLGDWSHRWFNPLLNVEDLDPQLLMWDMHRRLHRDRLPARRVVLQFDFHGARTDSYWLILEPTESSVCWHHPGFEVDLLVTADTLAMHRVWLGHQSLGHALERGHVELDGPTVLIRGFPHWLALSMFAAGHQARTDPAWVPA